MVDWFEKPENKWLPAEVGHNIFKKAKKKMDLSHATFVSIDYKK